MTAQLAMLNWMEVIAIMGVCLVLFGAKKLPELAQGLGKGLREFKKAASDLQDEAMNLANQPQPLPPAEPPHTIPEPVFDQEEVSDSTSHEVHSSTPEPEPPKAP